MRIRARAAAQERSIGMVVTQLASAVAGQFALSLLYSWSDVHRQRGHLSAEQVKFVFTM